MKFVLTTGPQAVGKMTVRQELSKNEKGLIFTTTWEFDRKDEWNRIYSYFDIFKKHNAEIYIVELEATLEERLKRNITENRLNHKASKRDLEWSKNDVLKSEEKYRFNSKDGEIKEKNYIKINNEKISAEDTAKIIKGKFEL